MLNKLFNRPADAHTKPHKTAGSVPCIKTDDVDAWLSQARANGGQPHGRAFYVSGVGKLGFMTDAEGRLIAVRSDDP